LRSHSIQIALAGFRQLVARWPERQSFESCGTSLDARAWRVSLVVAKHRVHEANFPRTDVLVGDEYVARFGSVDDLAQKQICPVDAATSSERPIGSDTFRPHVNAIQLVQLMQHEQSFAGAMDAEEKQSRISA